MCCTFRSQDPDPPDPKPPASGAQIYELSDKASAHFPADSAMQIVQYFPQKIRIRKLLNSRFEASKSQSRRSKFVVLIS